MLFFQSDSVRLAYLDTAKDPAVASAHTSLERPPVLLVHGFASNQYVNWIQTGWVQTLVQAGFRVVTLDHRGHGESEKLYEAEAYTAPIMAEDVRRLLDHLEIPRAHVMGYSMGARIIAFLALAHPNRLCSIVFAGLGMNMIHGMGETELIVAALEADKECHNIHPRGRAFREFALRTKSDLKALAACMRAVRMSLTHEEVASIGLPALVVVGSEDDLAGSGTDLAAILPKGEALIIPRRTHMSVVGDSLYKEKVLTFFQDLTEESSSALSCERHS